MTLPFRIIALLILLPSALCSGTDLPEITRVEPPAEVVRDTTATITGNNFPTDTGAIAVRLAKEVSVNPSFISSDKRSFLFAIPKDVPLGRYTVRVDFKSSDGRILTTVARTMAEGGQLRVMSDSRDQVKISAVDPLVGYPTENTFAFALLGEGFSERLQDNILEVAGSGELSIKKWVTGLCDESSASKRYEEPTLEFVNPRKLCFWGIPKNKHQGPIKLRVRVGEGVSETSPITLSRISKGGPLFLTLIAMAALAVLVYSFLLRIVGKHQVAGKPYGPIRALLLDKETDTYSLSKFQFLLWTAAAVFGWVYLSFSRMFVQWNFAMASIPDGLPGILAISASTTAVAVGITESKGTKGAGPVQPSMADLISTGGLVVAERFQFFVWTVLGVAAFIALVIASDPGQIQKLPEIPQNFLYLMGISSFGYLGGKLARKAGPVIDEIIANEGSLILEIHGRNLSQDAQFKIDDTDISADLLERDAGDKDAKVPRPFVVEKDDQTQEPNFAKILRLTLKSPEANRWLAGKHTLAIINRDGQRAEWEFEVKPSAEKTAGAGTAPGGGGKRPQQLTNPEYTPDIKSSDSIDGSVVSSRAFRGEICYIWALLLLRDAGLGIP